MAGKQRVAILKSRLYKGGVAQVLGHLIAMLNEEGIVPDILTLRADLDQGDFEKLYGLKINFKIKLIGPNLKMPYEWHFIYFNLLTRGYTNKYDLFINSNNTSFLAPRSIRTVTYVHYPRKHRALSNCSSIHFPELVDKSPFDYKNDLFFLAKFLYSLNKNTGNNEILIANSEFTSLKIQESYPNSKSKIHVIYPPVPGEKKNADQKKMQVMSLGRISEEKRQLEQIEIAAELPSVDFYITGFSDMGRYYQKCQKLIVEKNSKNVFLIVNQDYSKIQKLLDESLIFLHSVRNEPFGIGIVQAALNGCIPVIHGSGGAIEIVQDKSLHYTDKSQAIQIIKDITEKIPNFKYQHRFGPFEFKNRFREILELK